MPVEPTVPARPVDRHLTPEEVAAHVDRPPSGGIPDDVIGHLARCGECRAEIEEVARIVRTRLGRVRRLRHVWIPAAAAASLLLFFLPRTTREPELPHREGSVTTTVGPRPAAPLGLVVRADFMVWSSVSQADAYRLRLFDGEGTVLWEGVFPDTLVPLPPSIDLMAGTPYFWRVEARTGFGRWVASDLVRFSLLEKRDR